MSNPVLSEITKEHALKHAETVDKSAPVIDSSVHVKESVRPALLQEIGQEHHLKHADTVDKAAPKIDTDVHVKESVRPALFAEIQSKAKDE